MNSRKLSFSVKKIVDQSTFVCFDLDDTLVKATTYFGSEKWEQEIKNSLRSKGISKDEATLQAINFWQEAQKKVTIKWNSTEIYKIFFEITNYTNQWCILTARSDQIKSVTIEQIKKSLDFENEDHHNTLVNRLIFCGGMNKGKILKDFFHKNKMISIKKILIFDDKEKNINDIKNHLKDFHVIGMDLNEL